MAGKFKLIAGLGNKDINKVKDLVLLWMEAGADIFDVSPYCLPYVQKACIEKGFDLNKFEFCTSVAILGDIHGKKVKIDPIKCVKCGNCAKKCGERVITPPNVDEKRCIGCGHCKKACKFGAIGFYDDVNNDLDGLLRQKVKLDAVEIHISTKDKKEIKKQFKKIVSKLENSVKISVCLNRTYFSNQKTEKILSKLKELSAPHEFVVQADGNSMNGGNPKFLSTLEAVSYGAFIQNLGYEVILSGGCNDFTAELVKNAGFNCSIGFGSFARNLIAEKPESEALLVAKNFVLKVKKLINE